MLHRKSELNHKFSNEIFKKTFKPTPISSCLEIERTNIIETDPELIKIT